MFQDNFKFQEDEKILIYVRRHWLFVVLDCLETFFKFIIPAILLWSMQYLNWIPDFIIFGITFNALLNILLYMWGVVCWLFLAEKFTDYILDFWIVTDKRIIECELIQLFSRRLSTLELQDIEDITIQNKGFFGNFFNYGNLEVQTAGAVNEFMAEKIANPEFVQRTMFEAKLRDEQDKLDIEKQEFEQIGRRVFKEENKKEDHTFDIPHDQKRVPSEVVTQVLPKDEVSTEEFDWAHVKEMQEKDIRNKLEQLDPIEEKYKKGIDDALRTE